MAWVDVLAFSLLHNTKYSVAPGILSESSRSPVARRLKEFLALVPDNSGSQNILQMSAVDVLILGAGYVGKRLGSHLQAKGLKVALTKRSLDPTDTTVIQFSIDSHGMLENEPRDIVHSTEFDKFTFFSSHFAQTRGVSCPMPQQ